MLYREYNASFKELLQHLQRCGLTYEKEHDI